MKTYKTEISYTAGFIILMLCSVYVNAGDNFVGGSSFGATCTDDANGKTCSCTPPKTSGDCARLLNRCKIIAVEVDEYYDDMGHPQTHRWIPDVTCTATKCECAWIENASTQLPKPAVIQNQILAPTKNKPGKPPLSKRFQKTPSATGINRNKIAPDNITGPSNRTEKISPHQNQQQKSNLAAPKNAKCAEQSRGLLSCTFGGKEYNCDGKRKNCVQTPTKTIRKLNKEKIKSGNKVMHFDEADALFGKRP